MQIDGRNPLVAGFFEAFKVPTRLTVTEWADRYCILPSKGSSEPGPYRSSRTPYAREIMDALSVSSPAEEVIFMAGAQISKSQTGNNWVGYVIDNAPGPMLLVQPTVDNVKRYSKQRITPMIQAIPSLSAKIIENKSREGGNTIQEKEFPGGILIMGGANSAAGLRSMPIRYLFADEISNWPQDVDGEGDPLLLAEERTNAFGRKRKIFKCSTPSVTDECRIEAEFLKTDQRRYFVPCPDCGHMHVLMWSNFIIPVDSEGRKQPKKAHMVCPENGCVIEEHRKTDMLNRGEWRATVPDNADPTRVGYHISGLYSPVGWKSWAKIARQWIEAQGNPTKLQAFVNNVLAETWNVKAERVDSTGLMARAEDYGNSTLPDGAVVLTAGVDVQHDRLEVEIVGWGIGEETWSIDYVVIHGDPTTNLVWQQLDQHLISRTFNHPAGIQLRIARAFIDSSDQTARVYEYTGPREGHGIYAVKGSSQGEAVPIVGTPHKKNMGKVLLFQIGTIAAKDLIYGRLRMSEKGPGYCHFPKRHSATFYEQLTSNYSKTKYHKGFAKREYFKDPMKRDEALDCRVYATAAFYSLGVNVQQIVDSLGVQPQGRRVRSTVQ